MSVDRPNETRDRTSRHDERAPICPVCGVTMLPAKLSAREEPVAEWVCLECEETGETDVQRSLR